MDLTGHEVYASTMKSVSYIILTTIAAANNLEVMTGDIGNAYLNAETEEKIYTRAGAEFDAVGLMPEGTFWKWLKRCMSCLHQEISGTRTYRIP